MSTALTRTFEMHYCNEGYGNKSLIDEGVYALLIYAFLVRSTIQSIGYRSSKILKWTDAKYSNRKLYYMCSR